MANNSVRTSRTVASRASRLMKSSSNKAIRSVGASALGNRRKK